jgi:hypothetical protein
MELPKKLLVTSALTGALLMPVTAAQAVAPAQASVGAGGTIAQSPTDTAVQLSPRDYQQGYRDGSRDAAADARQSAMAYCAGNVSLEGHPGHSNPNVDYTNGYEDGWNDAWHRAFHRNVQVLCPQRGAEAPGTVQ